MKALYFQPSLPRVMAAKLLSPFGKEAYWGKASPLVFGEVPEPSLPSPQWAKIKCRLSGICGSDLAAIMLKGSLDNPITQFISFPMFLGHEIVGEIAEVGPSIRDLRAGQRVAVYPILSCAPRAISPACPSCQKGDFHLCQNYAEGMLPPGQCIGVNNRTGGGFSEYVVAHRSQLFPVPDEMPDEHAVLFDPLGVGLHAVLMAGLEDTQTVLVLGSGIIGLSVIQIIRALNKKCKIYAVARYAFQKDLALQSGADKVLADSDDPNLTAELARELKAKQYHSRFVKPFFMGGFDAVFDCVGSAETIHKSIRWSRHGGKVILVGANPSRRFEWSLLYWKEIQLLGAISYAMETIDGTRRHAFDIVAQMIGQGRLKLALLPVRKFRLEQYQRALTSLVHKGKNQPVKVAFAFP
jgi:threonine dehydrogenase-like Zn-dependent dehydrogenase